MHKLNEDHQGFVLTRLKKNPFFSNANVEF